MLKHIFIAGYLLISCSSYAQANKTLKDSVFKKGDIIRFPALDMGASNRCCSDGSMDSLKLVAAFLKRHPELMVQVATHTDIRGSAENNLLLTDFRARSIRDVLILHMHADSSQLSYKGYGESNPIIPESQIGKAKTREEENTLHGFNRRTELIVTDVLFHELPSQALSFGETRLIYSSELQESRRLNIVLPAGYDTTKAYPVLYLLDGSANEDLLHIAGLVQFYNMLGMPDLIVVGIANVDRKRDFTHHTNIKKLQTLYPTTGHSDAFIRFLESELQPYIRKNFKSNGTNYIIGQSLGGLVATEILFKKPQLFSHYLIVSPSLWWDNESLLKQAPYLYSKHRLTFIFL